MRKIFTLTLGRLTPHDTVLIKPTGSDLSIVSMYTTDGEGGSTQLLERPITIESATSVRYETLVSSTIWIEIEGPYINELSIDDVAEVEVSIAEYQTYGECIFSDARMVFHKYISLSHRIDDIKDSYIQATLGVRTLDRYDNIIYSEDIEIGLNEDHKMITHANTGNHISLPHVPIADSIEVIVEGSSTDEYTVEGNIIYIDIPDGFSCYAIYTPEYLANGVFTKLNENISINSNNEIELRDDQCSTIMYSLKLKIYNTDITSANHTPIIRSLAVVASDK